MMPAPVSPLPNELTSRQLGLQRVPNRRRRRGLRRRAILFDLLALDLLDCGAVAQANAPRLRADLDDLEVVFLARLERTRALQRTGCRTETGVPFVTALALFNFRVVAKCFDVFAQFDERAERGDARNLALHDLPDLVLLEPVAPDVVDLLDTQRHAPVARLDVEHHDIHFFTNFGDLRRVLDLLVPAHLRHVYQAFDALFQLHEHAVVHDSDDLALHFTARRIFFRRAHPGIGHQLLH